MTPEAWVMFERLWCRTPLAAHVIRARMMDRFGIDITDPQETAARRGLVRQNSANPHAREERAQIAALARWQAPRRNMAEEKASKTAARYPVPPGGFRIGARL